MFHDRIVTVWSAPNYCYRCGNVAAILHIDEDGTKDFCIFEAAQQEARGMPSKKVLCHCNTSPTKSDSSLLLNISCRVVPGEPCDLSIRDAQTNRYITPVGRKQTLCQQTSCQHGTRQNLRHQEPRAISLICQQFRYLIKHLLVL